MKELGLSRPKWTSPGWPDWLLGDDDDDLGFRAPQLSSYILAFGGATIGAMPRVWPSSQVDHHCRGTAR